MPWAKKYAPKTKEEFIGNSSAVELVASRIAAFKRGGKPLLISGQTGVGKTSLVYVVADLLDLDVLEINASDTRNKAAIQSLVGAASQQQSLFFRGKIILIDEVDGVSGVKDRGAVITLVKLAAESAFPMVFTANDAQSDKLKALRKKSEIVSLDSPSPKEVAVHLDKIAKAEGISVTTEQLEKIAMRTGGDIRAAMNDFQILSTGKSVSNEELDMLSEREHVEALEQALLRIFKTTSAEIALPAFDSVNEQPDKIMLWIQEALPLEYKKPEDLVRAYDALAEADRFFGRIRRWQYYRFYVYIYNLISAGIAIAKDEKYPGMPSFKRPQRPLKIWIYNQKNFKRKRLAEQLAPKLHTSKKRVTQDILPFLKLWSKDEKAELQSTYGLDAEAMGWLA